MNRWFVGMWFVGIAPIALTVFQFGCSSTPPPAADTRAADEKTIRDLEAQWSKDLEAKDLDKDVAHYDNDASFLLTNMPIVTGKTSITGVHKQLFSDPNIAISFATSKVEVAKSGDLAVTQGSYSLTSTNPKSKKPETEAGKYLTVYKKQVDGSWKAIDDMLNADAPAVGAKGEAKPAKAAAKAGKKGKKGKK